MRKHAVKIDQQAHMDELEREGPDPRCETGRRIRSERETSSHFHGCGAGIVESDGSLGRYQPYADVEHNAEPEKTADACLPVAA